MKNFFKYLLAVTLGLVLGFVIIFLIIFGVVSSMKNEDPIEIADNSVLLLKLDNQMQDRAVEKSPTGLDFKSMLGDEKPGMMEVLEAIEKAKTDKKIKGIYLDVNEVPTGLATLEEIRNGILDFKTSGKFVYAYADDYEQREYYLATAADSVFLNPAGSIIFKGLNAQIIFLKGMLEKIGVQPEIIRHGKFKSAVEPLIADKMSDENKEQTRQWLFSIWNYMLNNISVSRNISVNKLNMFADSLTIRTGEQAVENKLIDRLIYKDQMMSLLKVQTGKKKNEKVVFTQVTEYNKAPRELTEKEKDLGLAKDKIAVIYCIGSIVKGEGQSDEIGANKTAKMIADAAKDSSIKAIVLRVNSGGGSALASEIIWREVVLAKTLKPVIASMGDYAASGGYYIVCQADTVLASPTTLTGSIGVFGVFMNVQKLMNEKLGVTSDNVKTNTYADLMSPLRTMTETEKNAIQTEIEKIYETFITHVSKGRNISKTDVDSIGQGRVWVGLDAKQIKLVDKLGGLTDAIKIAAQKSKLKHYRIVSYPEKKDFLKQIFESSEDKDKSAVMREILGTNYKYFTYLEKVTRLNGIQALIPFVVEID